MTEQIEDTRWHSGTAQALGEQQCEGWQAHLCLFGIVAVDELDQVGAQKAFKIAQGDTACNNACYTRTRCLPQQGEVQWTRHDQDCPWWDGLLHTSRAGPD